MIDLEAIAGAGREECAAALAAIAARMLQLDAAPVPTPADDLVDVQAAAQLIGISPLTLSHKRKHPPYAAFVVPTGSRVVRYSRARIEAWKQSAGSSEADPAVPPRERKRRVSPPARSPQPSWLATRRGRSS